MILQLRKRRTHLLHRIEQKTGSMSRSTYDVIEFHALVWAIEELVKVYPELECVDDRKLSTLERR